MMSKSDDDGGNSVSFSSIPDNVAMRNLGFENLKDFLSGLMGVKLSGSETLFGLVSFVVKHKDEILADIESLEDAIGGYVYCSDGSNDLRRQIVEDFYGDEEILKSLKKYLVSLMSIRHAVTGASDNLGKENIQRAKFIRNHVRNWEWAVGEYEHHRETLLDNLDPEKFESAIDPYHKDLLEIVKTKNNALKHFRKWEKKPLPKKKDLVDPNILLTSALKGKPGKRLIDLFTNPNELKINWDKGGRSFTGWHWGTKTEYKQHMPDQIGPEHTESTVIQTLADVVAHELVEIDEYIRKQVDDLYRKKLFAQFDALVVPEPGESVRERMKTDIRSEFDKFLLEMNDKKMTLSPELLEELREFKGIVGHSHITPHRWDMVQPPKITSKENPFVDFYQAVYPDDEKDE